jgi:hypothetical protein
MHTLLRVSRCGFTVLVLGSALLLAPQTLSAVRDNPPPSQAQAAADAARACTAQGLKPGSDALNQCVQQKLGATGSPVPPAGGVPAPQAVTDACKAQGLTPGSTAFNQCVSAAMSKAAGPKSPSLTAAQQAAIATCKGKGLTENSDDYKQCIKEQTATGPALTPAQQAATDACKAKGIPQLTDAFKQCVNTYAQDPHNNSSLTPKQLAAFDVCKATGLSGASAALKDCLEKQLTTVTKAVRPEAEAELNAALAVCNAKHLKLADFRDCLKARLNK